MKKYREIREDGGELEMERNQVWRVYGVKESGGDASEMLQGAWERTLGWRSQRY